MNELAEVKAGLPAVTFTPDQVSLIKRTVANGTTDDELALFLYTAKRTGLDPLVRQIHAVKRGGKMAIQVGVDGFRLVAQRSNSHAGTDDAVFETGDDGVPVMASVTVYKIVQGTRVPFTATARWAEYFPGEAQGFMWKKMPFLMLSKCAECLALRKAFPAELSGVYSPEEMAQAGPVVEEQEPVSEPQPKSTGVFITEVKKVKTGTTKNGKEWNLWVVKDSKGGEYSTLDDSLAALASSKMEEKSKVKITSGISPKGKVTITDLSDA